MDTDETLDQEAQERLDRVRAYYYLGRTVATKEEINEAIKRVKEHMRSMTAKDIVSADKYWQFTKKDDSQWQKHTTCKS